ncbi:hypothetical protein M758_1G024300 [Ceratodon purpureus]|nr:hypothetical protein M758_1G024300 [Ceratodon purpureus]
MSSLVYSLVAPYHFSASDLKPNNIDLLHGVTFDTSIGTGSIPPVNSHKVPQMSKISDFWKENGIKNHGRKFQPTHSDPTLPFTELSTVNKDPKPTFKYSNFWNHPDQSEPNEKKNKYSRNGTTSQLSI